MEVCDVPDSAGEAESKQADGRATLGSSQKLDSSTTPTDAQDQTPSEDSRSTIASCSKCSRDFAEFYNGWQQITVRIASIGPGRPSLIIRRGHIIFRRSKLHTPFADFEQKASQSSQQAIVLCKAGKSALHCHDNRRITSEGHFGSLRYARWKAAAKH